MVVVIRVSVVVAAAAAIAVVIAQWVTQIQLMIQRVLTQNMRPLTMLLEVAAVEAIVLAWLTRTRCSKHSTGMDYFRRRQWLPRPTNKIPCYSEMV